MNNVEIHKPSGPIPDVTPPGAETTLPARPINLEIPQQSDGVSEVAQPTGTEQPFPKPEMPGVESAVRLTVSPDETPTTGAAVQDALDKATQEVEEANDGTAVFVGDKLQKEINNTFSA